MSIPRRAYRNYYVEVSEWGVHTLVIVKADNVITAMDSVKQKAGKVLGWEGIHNVYRAWPLAAQTDGNHIRFSANTVLRIAAIDTALHQ